jgi:AraC-like DNA-binding protein
MYLLYICDVTMERFEVSNISVYQHTERSLAQMHCPLISLLVSGMEFLRLVMPDGREKGFPEEVCPSFFVAMPGTRVSFVGSQGRENWVVAFQSEDIRYSSDRGTVELRDRAQWVPLPTLAPIPREWVPGWQVELRQMREMLLNPIPRNLLRARLGFMNILRCIIDLEADVVPLSPAARLKSLIDDDRHLSRTISELSRSCGYSRDYLRLLFQRDYGITPHAYGHQLRMARVMELIANSTLSVKQIANQTGFSHVAHLCGTFRREFGITPGQGIKRFRTAERRVAPVPSSSPTDMAADPQDRSAEATE